MRAESVPVAVALGSNLASRPVGFATGDPGFSPADGAGVSSASREDHLRRARGLIGSRLGRIIRASRIYETDPFGPPDQGRYLNQVILLRCRGKPEEALARLQEIEETLGRVRERRWGPRTIDLDLLLWGTLVRGEPELTLPHPRLHERAFVLVPLIEVLPDWRHPGLGRSATELLAEVDRSGVSLWKGSTTENGS